MEPTEHAVTNPLSLPYFRFTLQAEKLKKEVLDLLKRNKDELDAAQIAKRDGRRAVIDLVKKLRDAGVTLPEDNVARQPPTDVLSPGALEKLAPLVEFARNVPLPASSGGGATPKL